MDISDSHFDCINCSNAGCTLKYLSAEELSELKDFSVTLKLGKSDIVSRQGTPLTHIVYLKSGLIKSSIEDNKGDKFIISISKPGALIGIRCAIDSKTHSLSSQLITEGEVCYIDKNKVMELLSKNINFCYNTLLLMSRENLFLKDKLYSQMHAHLNGKLAKTILFFADDVFHKNEYELPLTKAEMAEYIGSSRERLGITFSEFEKEKIIRFSNNIVKILDRDVLHRLSLIG